MNLRDNLTAIMREHQIVPCSKSRAGEPSRFWALCEGCDWESDHLTVHEAAQTARASLRAAHESHIADLQIAYLRDNLAQHGDELGLTREFAVCVEDDGDVFLYGHRYLNRAIAQRESDEMTERFEAFVGAAWTTDWSRADD